MFLACFEAFKFFSFSMRIDNTFLIMISGDSATYLLSSCISAKCVFSVSLVKIPIFHVTQGM